ncbi:MAG: S-layer homology domain-containing protein [Acidimicrobiia bacterium]|nr:S-layer homology domain-containing protein [Acidimicrobiia bacterium]
MEAKLDLNRTLAIVVIVVALVAVTGSSAVAQTVELPPGGTFVDDDGTAAEGHIEAIAAAGITRGCNPPANDRFCPQRTLTRAEMATLLVRALELPSSPVDHFTDDNGTTHEDAINSLAETGITHGCGDLRFCGSKPITRGQMASFLARAFAIPAADLDYFTDDSESLHEASINALAAAGITNGCADARFCPNRAIPRAEMAMLLSRAMGLLPLVPPARPPAYPDVGHGKRIIYANAQQQIWMIDETESVVDTYLVSGREGVPAPGTYTVYSKSPIAWSHNGITMEYMVRFAYGRTASIGFHAIPHYATGVPMQTEDELGEFRSAGCVRQADAKAQALYAWTPIGTTVIVVP